MPHELERAPAAWSASQAAAAREAAAELRAARGLSGSPSVRRVQHLTDPLLGYAVLVACLFLFGPILTCGGFTLPVGTCAGAHSNLLTASSGRPQTSGLERTDEADSGSESWYSYRRRDGVTVTAFGVPPLGSTVIGMNPEDHPGSVTGREAGPSEYAGADSSSRSRGAARYRGR
jgi:hypothetical protein